MQDRSVSKMDSLAKSLFSDFECNVKPGLPRPLFQTDGFTPSSLCQKLNAPSIAREMSSPKSSDSLIDEMENIYEFMSPTNSPMKSNSSPNNEQADFSCSPPCLNKGLLNLRLFDTPHTPKTLFTKLKKASVEEGELNIIRSPISLRNRRSIREKFMKKDLQQDRKRPQTAPRPERNVVYANFNPFTPNTDFQMKAKRPRMQFSR